MQIPRFPNNRDDWGLGFQQETDIEIVCGSNVGATGRAKRGNFCMFEREFLDCQKKLFITSVNETSSDWQPSRKVVS
jgi:hypothetical protein